MTRNTTDDRWYDALVLELRLRQVRGDAIGDAVAGARELVEDSGSSAEQMFGPARDYAAALTLPSAPRYEWVRTGLWPALVGLLAFLVFSQAVTAWVRSEQMLFSPLQIAFATTPVVIVAFLPLYIDAVMRRTWMLVVLVLVGAAGGFLSGVVAPSTPEEAWVAVGATPWVVSTAIVMVALSILMTVRSRRAGSDDAVTDPRSAAPAENGPGARVATIATNWLFPILALGMLGFAFTLR